MADIQYKYVVLKNKAGEYLIPYCGMPDFAAVALSGSYNDLKDKPDLAALITNHENAVIAALNNLCTTLDTEAAKYSA